MRPLYFKGASGAVLVIRNMQEAKAYLEEIQNCCHKIIPILFVYINDEPIPAQLDEFLSKLNLEPITSGFQGIEWLATAMLSSRRSSEINRAAIYHVGNEELHNVLETLRQSQLHIERNRLETIRKQRSLQIELLKDCLTEMGLKIEHDTIQVLKSDALFTVNILEGNVSVFPLKCDQCQKYQTTCKREWHLCIIKESDGWSNDLMDSDSLLILSKIYALMSDTLPSHVINQINNIIRCPDYRGHSSEN